ncbi:hypothetical protein ACFL42_03970 [Candidatus Omnitrophota bacterium]
MRSSSKMFFRSILQGFLGISAEILLALGMMIVAFAVCVLWWGLLR